MTAIPAPIRAAVLERDGGCLRCGGPLGLYYSLHHRKGRGGQAPHSMANVVALCGSGTTGCHGWVHARPEESYRTGWLVKRLGADGPKDIPVLDLMGHWWLAGEVLTPFSPGGCNE